MYCHNMEPNILQHSSIQPRKFSQQDCLQDRLEAFYLEEHASDTVVEVLSVPPPARQPKAKTTSNCKALGQASQNLTGLLCIYAQISLYSMSFRYLLLFLKILRLARWHLSP
jgi:hypothetical protein